jgi:hypothetical protein
MLNSHNAHVEIANMSLGLIIAISSLLITLLALSLTKLDKEYK